MDQKISALPSDTSPATTDVMPIVNDSAGATQKITLSTLITFFMAAVKTLINTTFDTAGSGNSFKINGNSVSAVMGSGSTVVLSTGPTITNPTIVNPTITASVPTTVASSGSSGTTTFNLSNGNVQNFSFSGSSGSDAVTFALSNATTNQIFIVSITQNSGGSGTVTWWSTIRWTGGYPPVLTTTASKRDTFGSICTGAGTYDGFTIGQNL
jgi:hypothetical protein